MIYTERATDAMNENEGEMGYDNVGNIYLASDFI